MEVKMPLPAPESIINYSQLRARRAELGLYYHDLIKMTGSSSRSVCDFFNGAEHLNLRTIKKLATALRLKVRVEFVPIEELGESANEVNQKNNKY
jgi:hypothetical protein